MLTVELSDIKGVHVAAQPISSSFSSLKMQLYPLNTRILFCFLPTSGNHHPTFCYCGFAYSRHSPLSLLNPLLGFYSSVSSPPLLPRSDVTSIWLGTTLTLVSGLLAQHSTEHSRSFTSSLKHILHLISRDSPLAEHLLSGSFTVFPQCVALSRGPVCCPVLQPALSPW